MIDIVRSLLGALRSILRTHRALALENLALRQQLSVLKRMTQRRARLVEAFPEDTAPRYLLRDRDGIYGPAFRRRMHGLGISEVLTAARSPWQNPYAERVIGTIRRECLDHVIVLNERHLRRVLWTYLAYYHRSRCHLALGPGRTRRPGGAGSGARKGHRLPGGRGPPSSLRTPGGMIADGFLVGTARRPSRSSPTS